ncbi:MAG: FAD-dependent oxidoreductase [bacterium]
MKRNLAELSQRVFDLLIIGGGIYGASAAWDAASRGLSVALIEKGDFGGATSSNSLKIIHGGLRYLQHGDFKRMRESIHERMVLMRIAPHLVHPLPCVMPTYGHALKGKEVMTLALFLNDLAGFDRNGLSDPQKHLPRGHVISKADCQKLIPGVDEKNLTGGALWYDCHVHNSERMLLSYLHSAVAAGAQVANYVQATGFLVRDKAVFGIKAREVFSQEEFEIRARLVINNSGPWVNKVLGLTNGLYSGKRVLLSKTMNLVLARQLIPEYAVGVPSKFEFTDSDAVLNKGSRLLFLKPWRNVTAVGTTHVPYHGEPDGFRVTERDVQEFIDELSAAYPAAGLSRADVAFFNGGLLPMEGFNARTGDVRLLKQYILRDHQTEDGLTGLLTVVGVKYTTARDVAEKSIDLAMRKLGLPSRKSPAQHTPIHGGKIERFDDYLRAETQKQPYGLRPAIVKHLVNNYGASYPELLRDCEGNSDWKETLGAGTEVLKAEVIHGMREEMALKLADVVMRRTDLGAAGPPGKEALQECALLMAAELGWNPARVQAEIAEVEGLYVPA